METTTNTLTPETRSQTPLVDEDMGKLPLAELTLSEDEIRSDLVDHSFLTKKGIMVQFINTNCSGCSPVFGGIRLGLSDIRKAPAYLSKYKRLIRQHAVKALTQHLQDMQSSLGAGELINIDEFGMTFTVASVNNLGALMNPGRRQEGPLFFCHFPALVEPFVLAHEDWETGTEREAVHMINCYIHLLPNHQRRNTILHRLKEEKIALQAISAASPSVPHAKKPKMSTQTSSTTTSHKGHSGPTPVPRPQYNPPHQSTLLMKEIERLNAQLRLAQGPPFPALPASSAKTITWPSKDLVPELPDDM